MSEPAPPEEPPSAEAVRIALRELLGWDELARSPQLARFLTYIVEARLTGAEAGVKAYSIAVDVFGRSPDFDPQADPIVRVQARRLRWLLDQFNRENAARPGVRISLPLGRYVPEFIHYVPRALPAPPEHETNQPSISPESVVSDDRWGLRDFLLVGSAAIVIVFGLWSAWPLLTARSPSPLDAETLSPPRVVVLEFDNVTGDEGQRPLVAGLSIELLTDLQLFEDIDVSYVPDEAATIALPANALTVSGVVRRQDDTIRYGVILRHAETGVVVWNTTISLPIGDARADGAIDRVSRQISSVLGSHRGPVHSRNRDQLTAANGQPVEPSRYACMLLFHISKDTGRVEDANAAFACLSTILATDPDFAPGLAAMAGLNAQKAYGESLTTEPDATLMNAAYELSARAVQLEPSNAFVWEQAGRVRDLAGDIEGARAAYGSSLQLNPASDDATASFGRMLSLTAHWEQGVSIADAALTMSVRPPSWYYYAPALNALRQDDFAAALEYGKIVAGTSRMLGAVIVVASAAMLGDVDEATAYLPQVFETEIFRSIGILAGLDRRIADDMLVAELAEGLRLAGVPEAYLNGPF